MSNHLGDTNKMVSETPRTDDRAVIIDGNPWVNAPFARQLERELNAANQRIQRLEEALTWYESKVSDCNRRGPEGDAARDALAKDLGHKAKEAKP
jgi:hypothetical protein